MMVVDEASPEEVRGLAMLGASPMAWGRGTDLSARRDLYILNVMASEDEICSPKKGAVLKYGGGLVEEQFKKLPKSTRRVVIKGGNHASRAVSEAYIRHRRDSMLMLRAGASATTASRRTTASGRSASRTSRTRSRGTSSRSCSASGSAGSSGVDGAPGV